MVANAILLALAVMLAIGFALMDQLKFLASARSVLFRGLRAALQDPELMVEILSL